MKYKKYAALTLAVILAGTTLAGCGRQEEEPEIVEEPVAAVEDVIEEPVDEEEAITVIGDWQNASESVMMTNMMGGTIIGLAIKLPEDAEYPENLMETDQWFMNGEQAMVYYEPPAGAASAVAGADETAEITGTITGVISDASYETTGYESGETESDSEVLTEAEAVASAWAEANAAALLAANADAAAADAEAAGLEGEEYLSEGEAEVIGAEAELAETEAIVEADLPEVNVDDLGYFLEVTMENNKVYEITCFPIDDMDEVTLCFDDDVAYLQYTSLSEGTVVNTKAVEIIIKNNKEAAEAVTAMIAALPAVSELNAEAVAEQAAQARVSYNNLTPAQKAYVTNLLHLEELENSIKILIGEDALDAIIEEKELEDTDAIDADIEITETYDTSDVGGMAYRETYEDTEEWDDDYGGYDYGGSGETGTTGDQSSEEDSSEGSGEDSGEGSGEGSSEEGSSGEGSSGEGSSGEGSDEGSSDEGSSEGSGEGSSEGSGEGSDEGSGDEGSPYIE